MAQISYGTITITDITDIESIKNWYLATSSSSGVTKNTSGWTTTVQQMDASKQYLWNYEQILGTDNIEISSTNPVIIGHFGTNGQNGADGNSITSIDEYYKITNSTSNPGSSGWTKNSLVVPTNENKYLWNYQVINYSKTGSEGSYLDARIIGVYGDTGQRGTSILKVTTAPTSASGTADGFNYYYRMSLSTVKSQSGKSEVLIGDVVEYNSNHYRVGYVDSSYVYLSAATSIKGVSVIGVKEIYYLKTSSGSVPTAPADGTNITSTSTSTGVWTTAVPDYVAGAQYYTSIQTSLSSGTSPIYSPARVNQGLTAANQKALDAYNTSIARDTEINALQAQVTHFWWDSEGAHIAAGQNTTNVDNIIQGQPDTYAFNAVTAPGFLKLKYKNIDFAQLATNSLTFYRPATANSTYVQGKKAMVLDANALTFYKPLAYNSSSEPTAAAILSSTGLNITDGTIQLGTTDSSSTISGNLTLSNSDFQRLINGTSRSNLRLAIGANFGVKNDGTLYASNAVINGKIDSKGGFTVTDNNNIVLTNIESGAITLGDDTERNNTTYFNIKITDSLLNSHGPGILLRKGTQVLSEIKNDGLYIYDENMTIGQFTSNSVSLGKVNTNQFTIDNTGFRLFNNTGINLGAVEFNVGSTGTEPVLIHESNQVFTVNNTTSNVAIDDTTKTNPWLANTNSIYVTEENQPTSIEVSFNVRSNRPTIYNTSYAYSGTLFESNGNYSGTATCTGQSDISLIYSLDTGILTINKDIAGNLIGQVLSVNNTSEFTIIPTINLQYGGTSLTTYVPLNNIPINGTTFTIQFNLFKIENDIKVVLDPITFTAGTTSTAVQFIQDVTANDILYSISGTVQYDGPNNRLKFVVNEVVDPDTEEVIDAVYTTEIEASLQDFHTLGLCYGDVNVKINAIGKPPSYIFGSRRNGTIGANSLSVGSNILAAYNDQTIVGRYNRDSSGLFVVGNGDVNDPSNAFTVYPNGLIRFGDRTKTIVELNAMTANYDDTFLRIHDSGTIYGHVTVFKSDGNMIIGAGESPTYAWNQNLNNAKSGMTENLFLTADNAILFFTKAGTEQTIKQTAYKFAFSETGWAIVPNGISFNFDTGSTRTPLIQVYNSNKQANGTYLNYGCMGFRASGQKSPYFAFWTNQKDAGDIGRFYITQDKVYTANSTPFQSSGNFTADKQSIFKGQVNFLNNVKLYGKRTNDTAILALETCNTNNNCTLGWGGYDAQIGATNIYGNQVTLNSNNNIGINCNNAIFSNTLQTASTITVNKTASGDAVIQVQKPNLKVALLVNNAQDTAGLWCSTVDHYLLYVNKTDQWVRIGNPKNDNYLPINSNNVLWTGAYFMSASHSISLSQGINQQMLGIVLVWSAYSDGAAENNSWHYFFVPKWHVNNHAGTSVCFKLNNSTAGTGVCNKLLYISNSTITGNNNNTATGTGYANNTYVLRAVIGV